MFDGARNFFVENVLASHDEFLAEQHASTAGESRDLRRAVNAAVALSHMREYIPAPDRMAPDDIIKLCPDYALVRDIADAYKHGELDRKSALLVKAECLSERLVVTEYEDALGPFRTCRKTIVAELQDRSEIEVAEPFLNVLNFWIRELDRLGMLSMSERSMPSLPVPTRLSDSGAAQLELRMRRGERFHQSIVYRKHNPVTGIDEVVDLSGTTAQFRIRPIVQVLTLTLRKESTGEEVEVEIPLTEEQERHLNALAGDDERRKYLLGLLNDTEEGKDYARKEFGGDDVRLGVSTGQGAPDAGQRASTSKDDDAGPRR